MANGWMLSGGIDKNGIYLRIGPIHKRVWAVFMRIAGVDSEWRPFKIMNGSKNKHFKRARKIVKDIRTEYRKPKERTPMEFMVNKVWAEIAQKDREKCYYEKVEDIIEEVAQELGATRRGIELGLPGANGNILVVNGGEPTACKDFEAFFHAQGPEGGSFRIRVAEGPPPKKIGANSESVQSFPGEEGPQREEDVQRPA